MRQSVLPLSFRLAWLSLTEAMVNRPHSSSSGIGPIAGLGLQLAIGMAMFSGGGYWLDQRNGGGRLFTLLGIALGLLYCAYEFWKLVRAINRDEDVERNDADQQ